MSLPDQAPFGVAAFLLDDDEWHLDAAMDAASARISSNRDWACTYLGIAAPFISIGYQGWSDLWDVWLEGDFAGDEFLAVLFATEGERESKRAYLHASSAHDSIPKRGLASSARALVAEEPVANPLAPALQRSVRRLALRLACEATREAPPLPEATSDRALADSFFALAPALRAGQTLNAQAFLVEHPLFAPTLRLSRDEQHAVDE